MWSEFCDVYSPAAEEKREGVEKLQDLLIKYKETILDAELCRQLTQSRYNSLATELSKCYEEDISNLETRIIDMYLLK